MLVKPSDGMCQVCEKVMGYIKTHLNDQKTDKNIERFLGTMCSFLPIMYQAPVSVLLVKFIEGEGKKEMAFGGGGDYLYVGLIQCLELYYA